MTNASRFGISMIVSTNSCAILKELKEEPANCRNLEVIWFKDQFRVCHVSEA